MSLRIAHVVRRFVFSEWGGTENVVWNTALNQLEMGMAPEILATCALDHPGMEVRQGIPIRRFPYHYPYFPMPPADRLALDKKGGNPWSRQLFAALRAGQYAIVHIHCGGRLAATCCRIARQMGIPAIVTLHGGAAAVPPAEMAEMLRPVRHKLNYGRAIDLLHGIPRDPLAEATALICISREEQSRLKRPYPGIAVHYLPNGIAPGRFREASTVDIRQACQIPAGRRILLCISRIDYQKNQKLLLEVLRHDPGAHLLLIGPVTAQWYHDEILADAGRDGLLERLTLIPGVPPESPLINAALHAATAFALPSRHEPFGIAALEAWAGGTPLLAAAVGGLKDLVQDGVNGLLFSPDDPQMLLCAWRRLQDDPALRRNITANASAEVEKYTWPAIVSRLDEIYQDALARR